MDWDSKVIKKYIKEAEAAGLTLIDDGKGDGSKTYRCNVCKHEQEFFLHWVRKRRIKCSQCFQIKLEKEAQAAGWKLIDNEGRALYRTYCCNVCKYEQELRIEHVRKKNTRCSQCFQIKLETEAKVLGLTLIGRGKDANYRTYQFEDCKHKQGIALSDVRTGKPKCAKCLEIKHETEAQAVGLNLIGSGKNTGYRTYRFADCKHEQEIQLSHVRMKNFRCKQCLQIKLKQEAKALGLTLVGKGKSRFYRTYRFNDCKHEQEIQLSHIREDRFICNTCEETSRDLPSKVYLLEIKLSSFVWLKLGYAKNVNTRIKKYRLPKNTEVKSLKLIDFSTGREANEFEASIHKKYKKNKLSARKMRKFHKDGFNECYPMKMLDTLMEELDSATK